jgi:ribulose-5-phosphate 4-epimerase/fuculose-1-phosphate aldolase
VKSAELERIISAGRRLYRAGLVTGARGAMGVRLCSGEVVVTRAGSRLGFLSASDMLIMNGNRMPAVASKEEAAVDASLMAAVLEARPEAGSVVRVESPYATALSHRGRLSLERSKDKLENLGSVVFVPFYRPGTAGLAGAVATALRDSDIAMVECQGPVLWGKDAEDAVDRAEALEAAAKVVFILGDGENGYP